MKNLYLYTALLILGAGAGAADVSLSLAFDIGGSDSVTSIIYDCEDGEAYSVKYVIAGDNTLAIMDVNLDDRVFVNVVSASGARYVSGSYVWWSKGDTATLENELENGSILTCQAQ